MLLSFTAYYHHYYLMLTWCLRLYFCFAKPTKYIEHQCGIMTNKLFFTDYYYFEDFDPYSMPLTCGLVPYEVSFSELQS